MRLNLKRIMFLNKNKKSYDWSDWFLFLKFDALNFKHFKADNTF